MKNKMVVAVVRCMCGTALLITHALTGVDSILVSVSLVLLGIPFEALQHGES